MSPRALTYHVYITWYGIHVSVWKPDTIVKSYDIYNIYVHIHIDLYIYIEAGELRRVPRTFWLTFTDYYSTDSY